MSSKNTALSITFNYESVNCAIKNVHIDVKMAK